MRECTRLATDLQLMYVMVSHRMDRIKGVLAVDNNCDFEPIGWFLLEKAKTANIHAQCYLWYSIDDPLGNCQERARLEFLQYSS